jgi:hypothetical protein
MEHYLCDGVKSGYVRISAHPTPAPMTNPIRRKIHLRERSQVRVKPDAPCSVGIVSALKFDAGQIDKSYPYGYGLAGAFLVVEADDESGDYYLFLDREVGCQYQVIHDGKLIEEGYFRPDGSKRTSS